MSFITEEDYRVVIGEAAMKLITQCSDEVRANAEAESIEEISGYLRTKYDTQATFSAEGDSRNRQIVMITADIALYHMASAMPQKMGSEVRKERYERAVKWLEGVQSGRIVPDLPPSTGEDGKPLAGTFIMDSEQPLRHNW